LEKFHLTGKIIDFFVETTAIKTLEALALKG
jgi:hypothetical protein